MSKIPGGAPVRRALKAARQAVRESLRETNRQASKQLSKGNYAGAEALVAVGRAVGAFQKELDAVAARWKGLLGGGANGEPGQTPLWEYYQPILRALVGLGGTAELDQLLPAVQREMDGRFQGGDDVVNAQGRPRWQAVVRRAKRHMIGEGFIEATKGTWCVTAVGRRAAAGKEQRG